MPTSDRFLGRAEVYAAARPTYPAGILDWLRERQLLSDVADIGAGTGLFTQLLLEGGATVTAVEPNVDMRAQLETRLSTALRSGQLRVQGGTSEDTGLPDQSTELITAAQAAHWFDPLPTVREFRRVLKPSGYVLLLWNDWRGKQHPFNEAYGQTIRRFYRDGDDPAQINRVPESEIPEFMPGGYETRTFENPHTLSRAQLHALAGSVSYLPHPTDPLHEPMTQALDEIFNLYQQGGQVSFFYCTHVFLGQV